MTFHKQAKFFSSYSCKYVPWAFCVVNNGDFSNCEGVQELRCSICFPHGVLIMSLIGKKTKGKMGIITCNTLFGTCFMKVHVECEHLKLLIAFVEEVIIVHNI